jgi:hypothetical protein
MTISGGILGRCFCINAARQARSHLPSRGITDISSAREPSGVTTATHPSSTLKYSHVRRRESLSAFWSSRTALRLLFSSSRKANKAMSLEVLRASFIGILAAMSARSSVRQLRYLAEYCYLAVDSRHRHVKHRRPSTVSPGRWCNTDWAKRVFLDQTRKRPHLMQSAHDLHRSKSRPDYTPADLSRFSSL